jgi:hypothetical protein
MYAVGFAFVEVVNLTNERGNPFIGKDGTYKDIKWAVMIAALMYAFAGVVTLRGKEDLAQYCSGDQHTLKLLGNVRPEFSFYNQSAIEEVSSKPLQ